MDCPGCGKGESLGLKEVGGRGMVGWGIGVVSVVSMGESDWVGVWSFSKVPSMEVSFPLTDVMDSSKESNLPFVILCCSACLKSTCS